MAVADTEPAETVLYYTIRPQFFGAGWLLEAGTAESGKRKDVGGRSGARRRTYQCANGDACGDGGNGAGADVAGDAATGGEGGEDKGDVVERLVGRMMRCGQYEWQQRMETA